RTGCTKSGSVRSAATEVRAPTVAGEDIDCLNDHKASFSERPAFQLTLMTQGWDCSREGVQAAPASECHRAAPEVARISHNVTLAGPSSPTRCASIASAAIA